MNTRTNRKIARQTLGLSLAAPLVVAHRVGRMAAAGHAPNARDRKEFALMSAEKVAAFYESWAAMGWAALQAQQRLWAGMMFAPWGRLPSNQALAQETVIMRGAGWASVHRHAVGNAKRLARKKRT
jgi:hypothetical protein